jgi:hypothetical protein
MTIKFLRVFAILCLAVPLILRCGPLYARQLGEIEDGRWVYIAGSPNGAELFVDPKSIAFERKFDVASVVNSGHETSLYAAARVA